MARFYLRRKRIFIIDISKKFKRSRSQFHMSAGLPHENPQILPETTWSVPFLKTFSILRRNLPTTHLFDFHLFFALIWFRFPISIFALFITFMPFILVAITITISVPISIRISTIFQFTIIGAIYRTAIIIPPITEKAYIRSATFKIVQNSSIQ